MIWFVLLLIGVAVAGAILAEATVNAIERAKDRRRDPDWYGRLRSLNETQVKPQ